MRSRPFTLLPFLAACLLLTSAYGRIAHASVRMTCFFDAKVTKPRKADGTNSKTSRLVTFKILKLSAAAQSAGRHYCAYYVKGKPRTFTVDLRSNDRAALGKLKAGARIVVRLEAASWLYGSGSSRRAGHFSHWFLFIPPKHKPNP